MLKYNEEELKFETSPPKSTLEVIPLHKESKEDLREVYYKNRNLNSSIVNRLYLKTIEAMYKNVNLTKEFDNEYWDITDKENNLIYSPYDTIIDYDTDNLLIRRVILVEGKEFIINAYHYNIIDELESIALSKNGGIRPENWNMYNETEKPISNLTVIPKDKVILSCEDYKKFWNDNIVQGYRELLQIMSFGFLTVSFFGSNLIGSLIGLFLTLYFTSSTHFKYSKVAKKIFDSNFKHYKESNKKYLENKDE